jgi:hypothetical protein
MATGSGAASPPTPNQRTNQHANPAKQPRAGRKHGSDDMIAAAASGVGKQREGEAVRKKAAKTDMVLVRVTAPPAREGNPSGSGRAVTARVRGAARNTPPFISIFLTGGGPGRREAARGITHPLL